MASTEFSFAGIISSFDINSSSSSSSSSNVLLDSINRISDSQAENENYNSLNGYYNNIYNENHNNDENKNNFNSSDSINELYMQSQQQQPRFANSVSQVHEFHHHHPKPLFACNICHLSKVVCNGQRPCSSCITRNKGEQCTDVFRKQYKKRKITDNKITSTSSANNNNNTNFDNSNNNFTEEQKQEHSPINSNTNNTDLNTSKSDSDDFDINAMKALMRQQNSLKMSSMILSSYAQNTPPQVPNFLRLLGLVNKQLISEHFQKVLIHFGYQPPLEPSLLNRYSLWQPPTPLPTFIWPSLPDAFIVKMELSPTHCIPDHTPPNPNFASIFIGAYSKLKHLMEDKNTSHESNNLDDNSNNKIIQNGEFSSMEFNQVAVVNAEFERVFGYTQSEIREMVLRHNHHALLEILDLDSLFRQYKLNTLQKYYNSYNQLQFRVLVDMKTKWGTKVKVLLIKQFSAGFDLLVNTFIPQPD